MHPVCSQLFGNVAAKRIRTFRNAKEWSNESYSEKDVALIKKLNAKLTDDLFSDDTDLILCAMFF